MARIDEDTGFTCEACGAQVGRHPAGSYRNHCPHCLSSLHVDVTPGDRASTCSGIMRPSGIDHNGKKGYIVIHTCSRCGHIQRNKLSPDDSLDVVMAIQKDSAEKALREY